MVVSFALRQQARVYGENHPAVTVLSASKINSAASECIRDKMHDFRCVAVDINVEKVLDSLSEGLSGQVVISPKKSSSNFLGFRVVPIEC